ncbi:hypothetical protein ADK41_32135 [Streptomyces caelestis]|uniref:Uncharacterized protein n=1 Tax=Streptomyces caelestis TaxID=36816 RepID=A0A0M9X5W1_9ACTN|nr:hypothetical protein ADK41_32135 [Streptomyces caelestis]KOV23992.1 hypothetical protein ADK58_22130 [Streptomyces sp. XY152]
MRARGAVSAVAEEALGAGTVVSHRHEAATVEVLAVDCRRIVQPVAATWVRAEGSAGEPSSVGEPATAEPQPMPPAHRGAALSGTAVSANAERTRV